MDETLLDFLSVIIFYKFLSAANGSMACSAEAAEVKWFFGQWNGMVRRLPSFIATALNTNFRQWLHLQATQATQATQL